MRPSHVASAVSSAIKARRPVMLWAAPGVGKSSIVKQVAKNIDREMRDVRLGLLDPVDLKGFPSPNKAKTQMTWLPPDFLPNDGTGILFLDEINAAPPSVQAAAYQLILDRAIGNYNLPDGWDIVAAGNRETDRAVVHRMSSALGSRLVHLDMETSLDDWCGWAVNNGIETEVIGFLRFRPNQLHSFDNTQRTFPCPRTWEFVSDIMKAKPSHDVEFELLKGTVGEGAAAEFNGYIRMYRDLPNPDVIMLNPDSVAVPDEPAQLYALATCLAERATKDSMDRLMKYITRMSTEFQVVFMHDSLLRAPAVSNTKSFNAWVIANQNVIL